MPEVSRFLGIVIKMFYGDHAPPHFHAEYQGFKATYNIETGELIDGKMPPKQSSIVIAWTTLRKKELMANWKAVTTGKEPKKIAALR